MDRAFRLVFANFPHRPAKFDATAALGGWSAAFADEVVQRAVGSVDPYDSLGGVEDEPPSSFVDHGVVELAQQDDVAKAGGTAQPPRDDVVALAPGWAPVTPGEAAMLIT